MGFEQLEYTLVEGELTAVCVTFDKNLEKTISLDYLLQNLTGKSSLAANYNLMFKLLNVQTTMSLHNLGHLRLVVREVSWQVEKRVSMSVLPKTSSRRP